MATPCAFEQANETQALVNFVQSRLTILNILVYIGAKAPRSAGPRAGQAKENMMWCNLFSFGDRKEKGPETQRPRPLE